VLLSLEYICKNDARSFMLEYSAASYSYAGKSATMITIFASWVFVAALFFTISNGQCPNEVALYNYNLRTASANNSMSSVDSSPTGVVTNGEQHGSWFLSPNRPSKAPWTPPTAPVWSPSPTCPRTTLHSSLAGSTAQLTIPSS